MNSDDLPRLPSPPTGTTMEMSEGKKNGTGHDVLQHDCECEILKDHVKFMSLPSQVGSESYENETKEACPPA